MALGDRWSGSPGWLFGRLDFGLARGPNLCQIDRVSGAKDREDEIRKIRLGRRKLEFEQAFFFTTSLIETRSPWPGEESWNRPTFNKFRPAAPLYSFNFLISVQIRQFVIRIRYRSI